MAYHGKNEIKVSNVNYLGRDFNALKTELIRYTKSYFPNTYKDFNETSPGMMLLELSAYVGDVLGFYVDQQYREMLLPLAEERRNLINISKSYGYKTKAISPAYVTLTVKQEVDATTGTNTKPDYSDAVTIDKGMKIVSSIDSSIIFETLDIVDFKISSSVDLKPEVTNIASTGLPDKYTLTRKVNAISGETKTKTFNIGAPSKFLKLTLTDTNIIEILSVVDSNGNKWYEVDYLSQDKVSFETHYTSDENRSNAYTSLDGGSSIQLPVPYSLQYNKVSKRFIVEVDADNKTSLVFGNGILRNGKSFESQFLAIEQQGINLSGGEENLNSTINPLLGDAYGTLGEAPAHTIFTVTYRAGGGISSNIPTRDLTTIDTSTIIGSPSTGTLTVTNETPAAGGSAGETIEEIRQRSMASYSTQNRCVTKEDFEVRTLNMPAKFGNIAKVYSSRSGAVRNAERVKLQELVTTTQSAIDKLYQFYASPDPAMRQSLLGQIRLDLDANKDGGLNSGDFNILYEVLEMAHLNITDDDRLYTIDLYLLSYDNNKNLITTPNIVKQNLKQYLNQYRMLTDQISFFSGYIINFGVIFDVVAQKYENKQDVKLRCIQKIKDYYSINKMQFKQILYTSDIEFELMSVEGVRAVNYATLTQEIDFNSNSNGSGDVIFPSGLYDTSINSDGTTSTGNNSGYGYLYDFSQFYGSKSVAGRGIIMPAYEPSIFELKNPNQNIKGIVR